MTRLINSDVDLLRALAIKWRGEYSTEPTEVDERMIDKRIKAQGIIQTLADEYIFNHDDGYPNGFVMHDFLLDLHHKKIIQFGEMGGDGNYDSNAVLKDIQMQIDAKQKGLDDDDIDILRI